MQYMWSSKVCTVSMCVLEKQTLTFLVFRCLKRWNTLMSFKFKHSDSIVDVYGKGNLPVQPFVCTRACVATVVRVI